MERLTEKIDEYNRYFVKEPAHLNCSKVVQRLGAYEDAEEQGKLLKLHLKVGDTVYYVISTMKNPIDFKIEKIEIFQNEIIYVDDGDNEWRVEDFGKLIFLTKEEAEKAIADMGV